MRVRVVRLFSEGVPIPERDRAGNKGCVGELRLACVADDVRKRMLNELSLVALDRGGRPADLLPPLADVQLVALGGNAMVLTGFERIKRDRGAIANFVQSWWIRFEA